MEASYCHSLLIRDALSADDTRDGNTPVFFATQHAERENNKKRGEKKKESDSTNGDTRNCDEVFFSGSAKRQGNVQLIKVQLFLLFASRRNYEAKLLQLADYPAEKVVLISHPSKIEDTSRSR